MAYESTFALVPADRSDPAPSIGGGGGGGGGTTALELDFQTLVKEDLSSAAQTSYKGLTALYTAGGTVPNGSFVVLSYDTGGANPVARVLVPGSPPGVGEVVGLALNAAAVGEQIRVLLEGFGTARWLSVAPAATEVLLNASTTGTTVVGTNFLFRDSGGALNDYTANESNQVVFDSGSAGATWDLRVIGLQFEHSTYSMYDRLGVQLSADGVSWANASVYWWQSSSTTTAPWSTSYGGSAYNSAASTPGWIFPQDITRANGFGWSGGAETVTLAARYLRFTFISDGSSQRPGWNLELTASNHSANGSTPVAVGADIELDSGDLSRCAASGGGGVVAEAAWDDSSNNAVVVRL
jgi:hypothetical protein